MLTTNLSLYGRKNKCVHKGGQLITTFPSTHFPNHLSSAGKHVDRWPVHRRANNYSHRQFSVSNLDCGGNRRTQRKPTPTQELHLKLHNSLLYSRRKTERRLQIHSTQNQWAKRTQMTYYFWQNSSDILYLMRPQVEDLWMVMKQLKLAGHVIMTIMTNLVHPHCIHSIQNVLF